MAMSAVPGWYPDPASAQSLRYWSGLAWTEQTQPLHPAAAPVMAPVLVQERPAVAVPQGETNDVWLPAGMVSFGDLPPVCVKHGRHVAQMPRVAVYSRPPIWAYLLLVCSLLIGLIVILSIRVTITGPWPMCQECIASRERRKRAVWISLGVMVAAVFLAFWQKWGWGLLIGLAAALAAMIFGVLCGWQYLTKATVDRNTNAIHVRRPSAAFVQALPTRGR
jgi:hypothetical protein